MTITAPAGSDLYVAENRDTGNDEPKLHRAEMVVVSTPLESEACKVQERLVSEQSRRVGVDESKHKSIGER